MNSQHQSSDQPDLEQQLTDAKQTINGLKDNLVEQDNKIKSLQEKLKNSQDELVKTQDELEYHYQKSQNKGLLIGRYQQQQHRAKALIASLLRQINPPSHSQTQEPPQDSHTSP